MPDKIYSVRWNGKEKVPTLNNETSAYLQDFGKYKGQLIGRDRAGHANSAYKSYDPIGNRKARLVGDLDLNGDFMYGKHSSNAGVEYKIIKWRDL